MEGEREWHYIEIFSPEEVKAGEAFRIEVKVGKGNLHPSTLQHHIRWIKVFFKPKVGQVQCVAEFTLAPAAAEPRVSFFMKVDREGYLYAFCYCNLHGLFENSVKISTF